jgi:hypothetical protein
MDSAQRPESQDVLESRPEGRLPTHFLSDAIEEEDNLRPLIAAQQATPRLVRQPLQQLKGVVGELGQRRHGVGQGLHDAQLAAGPIHGRQLKFGRGGPQRERDERCSQELGHGRTLRPEDNDVRTAWIVQVDPQRSAALFDSEQGRESPFRLRAG